MLCHFVIHDTDDHRVLRMARQEGEKEKEIKQKNRLSGDNLKYRQTKSNSVIEKETNNSLEPGRV